ncbi:MAG: LamG-like jellyroll fold domain-containing protein, partial [Planctomycetota bacterium]
MIVVKSRKPLGLFFLIIVGLITGMAVGDMRGRWRFDEEAGSIACDDSGNEKHGTLLNMFSNQWVTGIMGNALSFDGSNDYVEVPPLNINSNGATITAWIKRNGPQTTWSTIFFNPNNDTCSGIHLKGTTNTIGYEWNGAYATYSWDSGLFIPSNKWVFVAVVVEPAQATMYLAQDGELYSAVNTVSHSVQSFCGDSYIGSDGDGSFFGPNFFKGYIDNVVIYNHALSPSEIAVAALIENYPPSVYAGSDITILEDIHGGVVKLNGAIDDDGLPPNPGQIVTTWSKVEGQGTVTFEPNEFATDPNVMFSANGLYELKLTASDGEFETNDVVIITYKQNGCEGQLLGDMDLDCEVNVADLAYFAEYWLDENCISPQCRADLDQVDGVSMKDFSKLAEHWQKTARYILRTDDTEVVIVVDSNRIFIRGLKNVVNGFDWIEADETLKLIDTSWIDSAEQELNWYVHGVEVSSGSDVNTLTITFANLDPSLRLRSIWSAHPGPGPIQHKVEIINTDFRPVEIDWMPSLNLDIALPQEKVKHWWVEKGSHFPTDYGTNITIIDDTFNYTGLCMPYDVSVEEGDNSPRNEPVPWQCIHATASEHGLYTGIESSACITQEVDAEGDANSVKLTLGIDETLSTFRAQLQPSEVYQMPPVFIGCFMGDVDDGSNRLRRWVENWLIPDKDDANLPLLVNNTWCWLYIGAKEENVMLMIDGCSSLGIEMCILDSGWYQKVGNFHRVGYWHPYPTHLPNGVRYVSDYAHSKGVRMGLWSSWTLGNDLYNVGAGVLSINGPGMSDWFSSPGPEFVWNNYQWDFTANYNGAVACLAYQPPRDWITNDMLRCINDYDIDHLKHDRRTVAQTCNYTHHGHLNNSGDISLRNAKAFYEM